MLPRLVVAALASGAGLCCDQLGIIQDPQQRADIAGLGPEDPAVRAGPRHRAGQPCAVCHAEGATAEPYTFAGTIYRDPTARTGVADVAVTFVDSAGRTFVTKTNCVGNFYVKPSEFRPASPTWVQVQLTGFPYKMASPIRREASCSGCHSDPAGVASAGHVFLTDDDAAIPGIPLRPCGPEDEVLR